MRPSETIGALLEHAPCGFLVVDDDGHVELANATAAEMMGASNPEAIVGRHVDYLLATPSRIFYQTHIFPTLKLQGRVHEVYVSMLGANGGEVPVLLNATRRSNGERTVSDWAIVPMRQRNELENELLRARQVAEAAVQAKAQFLALVSHELRSPLSAIRNWAAVLSQGNPDEALLRRAAETIERNVRLQSTFIDDILDEVRLATGKLHLNMVEVDARAVFESVMESAAASAWAKSIQLEHELGQEPLRVRADPDRLHQVFWNIVGNAIKFTPTGGRVRATMRRASGWVEAEVSDTGRGISSEFLPFVFEHFRQEQGLSRSEGGLGLGMPITRNLVELHGGSVFATSEGLGRGATFTVRLPALPAPVARGEPQSA